MAARLFAGVMTIVWSVRVGLELRYPVDVRIFILERPHPVLMPVLGLIAASFAVATWSAGGVQTTAR